MDVVLELLSRLEAQESRLLTWGIVDGGFSEDEFRQMAESIVEETGEGDPSILMDELLTRRLVFGICQDMGGYRYRTRMAETVRLLARLRQWFHGRDWRLAPTLVADFRFQARPRRYPNRHISPQELFDYLGGRTELSATHRLALEALMDSPDRGPLQLANFQAEATASMLSDLSSGESRGMIVCAGTGTGKTLAFYLPALAYVANLVGIEASPWTKGIAIYPRKELLKDQFSETYQELRRLDAVMAQKGRRKITIGAFFGPTPHEATPEALTYQEWHNRSEGYECPYLRCPKCEEPLYWPHAALEKQEEILVCSKCKHEVRGDEVFLTRERMAVNPPDFLFTTTEMLNRSMSDDNFGQAFGLGVHRPPHLLLLDEVHTYAGTTGAHVALLLRRYQAAIKRPLHITGLSATLENAADFFSTLVGLPGDAVRTIEPQDDMVAEGMEYMLALRGDPVSGTSLLSTTIQTIMLMRRCLDPFGDDPPSQGVYPPRLFAFTDDLDVTNRLFHNLLDAEGRDSFGHPSKKESLAILRQNSSVDAMERMNAGQSWQIPEEIGHELSWRLDVDRTSSQDQGVSNQADVVVATAALEVGYNDPFVGAVVQHKAPRGMAAFLQRKGRAGRRRQARPWTVVVLSDYGRDRQAYQSYDQLFSPRLEPRNLPISNRYVLRIQAAFATIDWIGLWMKKAGGGSAWSDLSKPKSNGRSDRQQEAIQIIKGILDRADQQETLERHLMASLRLSTEEVRAIMWEAPRPLMTGVLPTLLRRLESSWQVFDPASLTWTKDPMLAKTPLPDFVPPNFFSDLLLPEVCIITPAQTYKDQERTDYLPILQAMRNFAPGRVSRRFGVRHGRASHWIAPPEWIEGIQELPLEQYLSDYIELGQFETEEDGQVVSLRCVRPITLRAAQIPSEVLDTSNARLDWRTQLVPRYEGQLLELPSEAPWSQWLSAICAYTHTLRSPLEVRRFALGSQANLRRKHQGEVEEIDTYLRFSDGGPLAVGFSQDVDGLVFRIKVPAMDQLLPPNDSSRKLRSLRTARFRDLVLEDTRLDGLANSFQRDWLYQIFLSVLTARAITDGVSLQEALATLQAEGLTDAMASALDTIFQTLDVSESHDEAVVRQRTHEILLARSADLTVLKVLCEKAKVLWESPDETWKEWLEARFKATLGGAVMEACRHLVPQMDMGDLVLDLDPGSRPPEIAPIPEGIAEIWLSETTLGGGGVIEEIIRGYQADPARFFRLVEAALNPGDFEIIDIQLSRLLEQMQHNSDVRDAVAAVRLANCHAGLISAFEYLRNVLAQVGITLTHPVNAALQARILRPGASPVLDELLGDLIRRWNAEEARLGIEIDVRVFAFVSSRDDAVTDKLSLLGWDVDDATWRFQALGGLLWPRGSQIRSRLLTANNLYSSLPTADRDLIVDILQTYKTEVSVESPDWRSRLEELLAEGKNVTLVAASDHPEALQEALLDISTAPIELGYLLANPRIETVSVGEPGIGVRLHLEEGRIV